MRVLNNRQFVHITRIFAIKHIDRQNGNSYRCEINLSNYAEISNLSLSTSAKLHSIHSNLRLCNRNPFTVVLCLIT